MLLPQTIFKDVSAIVLGPNVVVSEPLLPPHSSQWRLVSTYYEFEPMHLFLQV